MPKEKVQVEWTRDIDYLLDKVKALQEEKQALLNQLRLTQTDYNLLKEKLNKIALILEV